MPTTNQAPTTPLLVAANPKEPTGPPLRSTHPSRSHSVRHLHSPHSARSARSSSFRLSEPRYLRADHCFPQEALSPHHAADALDLPAGLRLASPRRRERRAEFADSGVSEAERSVWGAALSRRVAATAVQLAAEPVSRSAGEAAGAAQSARLSRECCGLRGSVGDAAGRGARVLLQQAAEHRGSAAGSGEARAGE